MRALNQTFSVGRIFFFGNLNHIMEPYYSQLCMLKHEQNFKLFNTHSNLSHTLRDQSEFHSKFIRRAI